MARNFPQQFNYNNEICYIGALTFKEVEQITFGACDEQSLNKVKKSAFFKSEDEFTSNGEKMTNEFFWPKVYRMTFYDSTEQSEKNFEASLKDDKDVAAKIVDQFKVEVSDHFESLMLLYKYAHLTREDIEKMDYWYFQCLVTEIKKLIKKDDDNRKSGQSLGSN